MCGKYSSYIHKAAHANIVSDGRVYEVIARTTMLPFNLQADNFFKMLFYVTGRVVALKTVMYVSCGKCENKLSLT